MIPIDLSKQQAVPADPKKYNKLILLVNYIENTTMFFILGERNYFRFFTINCKSFMNVFIQGNLVMVQYSINKK